MILNITKSEPAFIYKFIRSALSSDENNFGHGMMEGLTGCQLLNLNH
jgi:hypothetical protein